MLTFFMPENTYAATTSPPAIILSSYSISGNLLTDEFITLHLVFTNTSSSLDVYDILISYTSANEIFLPVHGVANQFFIPLIPAGDNFNYDLIISVNNPVPNASLYFEFQAIFSDTVNGVSTNNFFISDSVNSINPIQLLGIDAVDINTLSREEIIISFKATVLNHSNSLVQNAVMILDGKAPDFTISVPLGDIGPGKHSISEFRLTFPSLNIPQFNIKFNYKDNKGTNYISDSQRINIYLNNLLSNNKREQTIFRVVGLVFSVILLGLWAYIFFIRLRKKKSL